MSYDLDHLPADFIGYIRALQAHAGHEPHAFRLARALNVRVRVGPHNITLPDAEPSPLIVVQPWWFGWNNSVLRHELAHIAMYWSGLEAQVLDAYGPDAGWSVIERLCCQAEAFLQIPQPAVDDAVRRHGVTARAVLYLARITGARPEVALRRLVYDNPELERAGFLTSGNYISETATCNMALPFSWLDREPYPLTRFPHHARVTAHRIPRGAGIIGVCSV